MPAALLLPLLFGIGAALASGGAINLYHMLNSNQQDNPDLVDWIGPAVGGGLGATAGIGAGLTGGWISGSLAQQGKAIVAEKSMSGLGDAMPKTSIKPPADLLTVNSVKSPTMTGKTPLTQDAWTGELINGKGQAYSPPVPLLGEASHGMGATTKMTMLDAVRKKMAMPKATAPLGTALEIAPPSGLSAPSVSGSMLSRILEKFTNSNNTPPGPYQT